MWELGLGLGLELGSGLEITRVQNAWVRKGYGTECLEAPISYF